MEPNSPHDPRSFLSNDYRSSGKQFSQESIEKRRLQQEDFLNQEVDYRDYVFAPEGYKGPVMVLYILILPYLVGLGFLFLFIARASYEYFLEFNLTSYFIIWAIGYEVSAVLLLVIIFFAWLNSSNNRYNREKQRKNNSKKTF